MIKTLTSALIKDLLGFLKSEKEYFSLAPKRRQALSKDYFGSNYFSEYISKLTPESFVDDLSLTIKVLKKSPKVKAIDSLLIKSISDYFVADFGGFFDQLNKDYYIKTNSEKDKFLEDLFSKNIYFFQVLKDHLLKLSIQELTEIIVSFLNDLYNSPRIVVQSPRE